MFFPGIVPCVGKGVAPGRVAEAMILGTMMVGQAVAFAPNYSKAKVAAARVFAMLERIPAIDTSSDAGLKPVGWWSPLLTLTVVLSPT